MKCIVNKCSLSQYFSIQSEFFSAERIPLINFHTAAGESRKRLITDMIIGRKIISYCIIKRCHWLWISVSALTFIWARIAIESFLILLSTNPHMNRPARKPTVWHLRNVSTQISLRSPRRLICADTFRHRGIELWFLEQKSTGGERSISR